MLANAAALLDRPKTVNVGVKLFYAPMAERTQAIHVDWRPAGWGDAALARIVAQLADDTASLELTWAIATLIPTWLAKYRILLAASPSHMPGLVCS
jgi:hypothetical protein